MQKQNLQTLKGFRDFLPAEKRIRDQVKNSIIKSFERYGFEPLETPTLEYAELLLGKYGDEADKLVYSFTDRGDRQVALRYDQTVPTARVLAQYQNELGRGFRRYQIQNVFRADKPQKGRYREFTQCDADIFGITSPLADAEILAVYYSIYRDLRLSDIVIELNDRNTLIDTLSPYATGAVTVASIIQSIDKLDKQSEQEVIVELVAKGLNAEDAKNCLESIKNANPSQSLTEIVQTAISLGVKESALRFNPTLARGLDYYTGMIFEGKIAGFTGSVGGGGRYDRLIESLGGPSIPAVGFGIGFDRTVEVCVERGLINNAQTTKVIVINQADTVSKSVLDAVTKLRAKNISAELYPEPFPKKEKPLKYASSKNIPFALLVAQDGSMVLRNLTSREDQTLPLDEIVELMSNRE